MAEKWVRGEKSELCPARRLSARADGHGPLDGPLQPSRARCLLPQHPASALRKPLLNHLPASSVIDRQVADCPPDWVLPVLLFCESQPCSLAQSRRLQARLDKRLEEGALGSHCRVECLGLAGLSKGIRCGVFQTASPVPVTVPRAPSC